MKFSICCTFSGGPLTDWNPCDIDMRDIDRIFRESWAATLSVNSTEEGDSEYSYLAEEGDRSDFWSRCRDVTVSGVLDRPEFWKFWDALGPIAEDIGTMGTLGAFGWQPDISCELESQYVIASIRVTPLPERGELSERNWNRIRAAFLRIFGRQGDAWRGFRRG